MALPTSIRPRSASERVAAKLGGEHRLRQFLARFADALEAGGRTIVEVDSAPGLAPLQRPPLILVGARAW